MEQDDEIFDDYFEDDEWDRIHNHMDDVVVAELEYLNAELDKSITIWRIGLIVSLVILFGSVIFIAVLMERRNGGIDGNIREVVEEIRPRVEDEGISVEYRTRSAQSGVLFFLGKYIRPTRVVVFSYLDRTPASLSGTGEEHGAGGAKGGGHKAKKTSSFFSEDYQRKYFPPSRSLHSTVTPRSAGDDFTVTSSTFSAML